MKTIPTLMILAFLFPTLALAQENKLNEQSTKLKAASEKIESGGIDEFIKWFPKNLKEFTVTCNNEPDFDQLYDCHDILITAVDKALKLKPKEIAAKLAILASVVKHDADAPNHLQATWAKLCMDSPGIFNDAVNGLEVKKQDAALKYLTYGISKDSNEQLEACSKSLDKAGFKKLSEKAKLNFIKAVKK